jgi:hypothetical protein
MRLGVLGDQEFDACVANEPAAPEAVENAGLAIMHDDADEDDDEVYVDAEGNFVAAPAPQRASSALSTMTALAEKDVHGKGKGKARAKDEDAGPSTEAFQLPYRPTTQLQDH